MFRTVPLPIIRSFSLYTQQWYLSYSLRAGSGWNCISVLILPASCQQTCMTYTIVPSWSCSQAVSKPVWHIPLLRVQWKTHDDGQRNCPKHVEYFSKNKFEKLVHLFGFIIRKKSNVCPATSDVRYRAACVIVVGRYFFLDSPHLYLFSRKFEMCLFLNKKWFWGFLVISSLFSLKLGIFPVFDYKLCLWRDSTLRRTVHRAPASGVSCEDYLHEINLLTGEKCCLR